MAQPGLASRRARAFEDPLKLRPGGSGPRTETGIRHLRYPSAAKEIEQLSGNEVGCSSYHLLDCDLLGGVDDGKELLKVRNTILGIIQKTRLNIDTRHETQGTTIPCVIILRYVAHENTILFFFSLYSTPKES